MEADIMREICNYSFAAATAWYLMIRIEKRLSDLSDNLLQLVEAMKAKS